MTLSSDALQALAERRFAEATELAERALEDTAAGALASVLGRALLASRTRAARVALALCFVVVGCNEKPRAPATRPTASFDVPPAPPPSTTAPEPSAAAPSASSGEEGDTGPGTYQRPPGCPEAAAPLDELAKRSPTLPGKLVIRPPDLEAPSHGVGGEPYRAIFCLRNLTSSPLGVRVGNLVYLATSPGAPADHRVQTQVFGWGIADDARRVARDGKIELTLPAGRWFALELAADTGVDVLTHTSYVHEATFEVGDSSLKGRGYVMMFRAPHRR